MVNGRGRRLRTLVVAALCGLGACAADERPLTQLILVADTDVMNVDTIQLEVSELGGANKETAQAVHGAGSGPAFVSLVRDDGSLGPLTVVARGRRGDTTVIERTQRVSFVAKQTRVVLLHLYASCLKAPRCMPEQACDDSGCIDQELAEAQLLPWTGTVPSLSGTSRPGDAGAGDAQSADAGSALFRECGAAGSVDIQSNAAHCGRCDNKCSGSRICTAGACVKP